MRSNPSRVSRLAPFLDFARTNGVVKKPTEPTVRFERSRETGTRPHVVAIDYGSKRNIFRNLADAGADVTVLPPPPASTR
jgi:carbamoyl-phosphate synthase small subunit